MPYHWDLGRSDKAHVQRKGREFQSWLREFDRGKSFQFSKAREKKKKKVSAAWLGCPKYTVNHYEKITRKIWSSILNDKSPLKASPDSNRLHLTCLEEVRRCITFIMTYAATNHTQLITQLKDEIFTSQLDQIELKH